MPKRTFAEGEWPEGQPAGAGCNPFCFRRKSKWIPAFAGMTAGNSAHAGFIPGNHEPLNLARALVDLRDLRIAEEPLERHFLRITHAAVDL